MSVLRATTTTPDYPHAYILVIPTAHPTSMTGIEIRS